MECLVCKSEKIILKPTKMSDFLAARIFEGRKLQSGMTSTFAIARTVPFLSMTGG